MSLVICNMMIIMLFGIVECYWLTTYTLCLFVFMLAHHLIFLLNRCIWGISRTIGLWCDSYGTVVWGKASLYMTIHMEKIRVWLLEYSHVSVLLKEKIITSKIQSLVLVTNCNVNTYTLIAIWNFVFVTASNVPLQVKNNF